MLFMQYNGIQITVSCTLFQLKRLWSVKA